MVAEDTLDRYVSDRVQGEKSLPVLAKDSREAL